MPEEEVASSKRIVGGCDCAAIVDDNSNVRVRNREIMSAPSSRDGGLLPCHICGDRGMQKHRGHGILRSCLRSGVAANANPLFAPTQPEPTSLLLDGLSCRI